MSPSNPLGYLTTDPVNAADALALADACGLPLEIVEPRDLPRLEREQAALVLDWDYLDDDRAKALTCPAVRIAGAHGYNIADSVAAFLGRRGAVCGRRLDFPFLAALADRAVAA